MIAPGHTFVWSSPKAPMIPLKSLFLEHQALRFKFSADPRLYAWSWLFLMECTSEKARRNTLLKHRRAEGACDRLSRNSGACAIRARSATRNLPARPMDAVPASTGSADGTFTVLIAHDLTYRRPSPNGRYLRTPDGWSR
jgi:hypothetical protein